jgi:alpha-glucosidase (family GH31 glycosyl hydrolase)
VQLLTSFSCYSFCDEKKKKKKDKKDKKENQSIALGMTSSALFALLCCWCLQLASVALGRPMQFELLPYDPVANTSAQVVSGSARFTVLTDHVIRLEYASNGKFEDRATVAVVNRLLPVPQFATSQSGSQLTITTNALQLKYSVGSAFSASTLQVTSLKKAFAPWGFSTAQSPRNLLGTIRSLDLLGVNPLNCSYWVGQTVNGESLHCEWALMSRDGWAVVDDSTNWGMDQNDWWQSPNTDQVDLYFFGHGLDYKQAVFDYSLIGGKSAMVPRYAAGIAWTRWYDLDNRGVADVVDAYKGWQMPLDTFILDMDWHTKQGWGGYSFDRRLFPEPSDTLVGLLKEHYNLAVAVNLHDDDGIRPSEDTYAAMCYALGYDANLQQTIPFQLTNRSYALALEDITLGDIERQGVDFMWIDWQQGGSQGGCSGEKQNPTIWLQKLRATDAIRRGQPQRGIVLSRFGGLGAHRYQVGFSGDVVAVQWNTLAYQPYFSYTGANVLYSYWSHDIVGAWSHDHELHTRWIQWGSVSGHFRTHDRGMSAGDCANSVPESCAHVAPWNAPPANVWANRLAMQRRAALVPYIYNAARAAYDTGIGLIYPMYYEWPQCDDAYRGTIDGDFAQYFYGADMISAPVVTPADNVTALSTKQIWLPPGAWYDVVAGSLIQSPTPCGQTITRHYSLEDQPMFVRGGAIVPRRLLTSQLLGTARSAYDALEFTVYPGGCGSLSLYEDDAETTAYARGDFSEQAVRCTQSNAAQVSITIDAAQANGAYSPPSQRRVIVRFPLTAIAQQVLVDGNSVSWARFANGGGALSWHYDARDMSVVVDCGSLSTGAQHTVSLVLVKLPQSSFLDGVSGLMNRAIIGKASLDFARDTPGSAGTKSGSLMELASASETLSAHWWNVTGFTASIAYIRSLVPAAITELQQREPYPIDGLVQLYSASRQDNLLCGTQACISTNLPAVGYTRLRVEGYQPDPSWPGVQAINDWWSAANQDNYATDQSGNIPSGYVTAVFADGVTFASQQPNTVPLRLFWSAARTDFLTVASSAGLAYAAQNNYVDMNHTVGWVLTKPWRTSDVDERRWNFALALLRS